MATKVKGHLVMLIVDDSSSSKRVTRSRGSNSAEKLSVGKPNKQIEAQASKIPLLNKNFQKGNSVSYPLCVSPVNHKYASVHFH